MGDSLCSSPLGKREFYATLGRRFLFNHGGEDLVSWFEGVYYRLDRFNVGEDMYGRMGFVQLISSFVELLDVVMSIVNGEMVVSSRGELSQVMSNDMRILVFDVSLMISKCRGVATKWNGIQDEYVLGLLNGRFKAWYFLLKDDKVEGVLEQHELE